MLQRQRITAQRKGRVGLSSTIQEEASGLDDKEAERKMPVLPMHIRRLDGAHGRVQCSAVVVGHPDRATVCVVVYSVHALCCSLRRGGNG